MDAATEELVKVYKDDLESNLDNKMVQFISLIDLYKNYFETNQSKELFYYHILENQNFRVTFPNIEIILRMFFTPVLMASNCPRERSFKKIKIIKNKLRTTMGQNRLPTLSLSNINLLRELDFSKIINDF